MTNIRQLFQTQSAQMLYQAVTKNTPDSIVVAKDLLALDVDPNYIHVYADTKRATIHAALKNKNTEILELLLQSKRIDMNVVDGEGQHPLTYAAKLKLWPAIKLMVQYQKKQLNPADLKEALRDAITSNEDDAIKAIVALFEAKVNPNFTFTHHSKTSTCLSVAIQNKNEKLVKLLLLNGVDVNLNANNQSAIQFAAKTNAWNLVNLIAKAKNHDKKELCFAIMHALKANTDASLASVPILIQAGADLTKTFKFGEKSGCTVLHLAALTSPYEIILSLLKNGANPSAINEDMHTPGSYIEYKINNKDQCWQRIKIYTAAVNDLAKFHTARYVWTLLEKSQRVNKGCALHQLPKEIWNSIKSYSPDEHYPVAVLARAETLAVQKKEAALLAQEKVLHQKILNEECRLKCAAFKKIYVSLSKGQTINLEFNFLTGKENLSDENFYNEVKKAAKKSNKIHKTLALTEIHWKNCNDKNIDLVQAIHQWSYEHSGLIKKSTGINNYSFYKKYRELPITQAEIDNKLLKKPESRLSKIVTALR